MLNFADTWNFGGATCIAFHPGEYIQREEYGVTQGEPDKELLRVDEGFCFITGVRGNFQGSGEKVEIVRDGNRQWLHVESQQQAVVGTATCVRYNLQ